MSQLLSVCTLITLHAFCLVCLALAWEATFCGRRPACFLVWQRRLLTQDRQYFAHLVLPVSALWF